MNSMANRFIAWSLLAIFVVSATEATPRLPFRHYGTEEGLPQSQVLAVHQDSRGELWIGTWNGAARYDGATFRYVTLRTGLPQAMVFDIEEDQQGNIYFAAGKSIARLGSDRIHISEVFDPEVSLEEGSWLRDLFFDRQGRLWGAARHGGVALLESGSLCTIETPDLIADVLNVWVETVGGELLLGTEEGVFVVENEGSRRWRAEEGPWNEPIHMLEDLGGGILAISTAEGVWRLATELRGGRTEITSVTPVISDDKEILRARSALVDRFDQLWLAADSGFYREFDGRMSYLSRREGLAGEGQYYSLTEDREGNLWFGSDSGLSLHPGDLFRVYPLAEEGAHEQVWSLAFDDSRGLLVGTRTRGVFRFEKGQFTPFAGAQPNPLLNKRVRTIIRDDLGRMWFGTQNDGLYRLDGEVWRNFRPPELPSARIYGAFRDRHGGLWFATQGGVASFAEERFQVWTAREGLPSEIAQAVKEDAEGRILAATTLGLARFEGGKFVVPPELEALSGIPVRCLLVRRDGTLWAGTEGLGLYALIDGAWQVFQAGDGPSDDFAWGLIEDQQNRLWLATNKGLDLYDGKTWTLFSKRDGLLDHELASNVALATPDGASWFSFPGGGGLVRFPAELPQPLITTPTPSIISIETSDREQIEAPFQLELPWRERDVTFTYIATHFRNEGRVVYRTKLEGYDSDYTLRSERRVRYTNLAPGSYRFSVLAAGPEGAWTTEPAVAEIEILPPFYRTWWFSLLAAACLGATALSLHRFRLRTIANEKKVLAAKVEERTKELVEEKGKLEDALTQVQALSGLLPICASCNRIRDEEGDWERLELYIEHHSEASFSHSLCPNCVQDLYPTYGTEKG